MPLMPRATKARRTSTGSTARYWAMPPATPAIIFSFRLRISRWVGSLITMLLYAVPRHRCRGCSAYVTAAEAGLLRREGTVRFLQLIHPEESTLFGYSLIEVEQILHAAQPEAKPLVEAAGIDIRILRL